MLFKELLPGFIPESDESMDSFHFCILPILILLLPNEGLFILGVLVVVGVIKFIHLVGCAVRVIPNEFFRFVELLIFEKLLGLLDGVGEDRFEVMVLYG